MCSIKLTNLCVKSKLTTKSVGISALPVSSFGVPPFTFQTISNTDIFQAINPETLKPDDPPPLSMATLPGTDRRPRKPWQMCNENEKQMEMVLACSLDQIIELAIDEGIAIPDPEDFTIPLNLFPTREERLKKFCVWYAGDEEKNKIPGQGIPTLARVVLSETFEDLSVDHDPFVLSTMQHNNMPMPPFCLPEDHPDYRPKPEIVEEIHDGVKRYHLETISVDSNDEEEEYATLLQAYERAVTTGLGKCLRINLISRTVNIIMSSRRTGMLRYIWPPGPARSGLQYMFPRMGIISPKFELPARRIKVFPSRSIESYTYAEMTHWYSLVDLEDDDMIMRKAEADGVRLREYNEWLSHEKERVVESRLMMTDEDYRGKLSRESWKLIEKNFKEYSIALEEKVLARDKDDELQKMGFMFSHDLPKEYWYIFEESTEFRHGNGIDNGDELEDIRLAQYERGKIAREEAIKFENYLQEERKKRDAEEQARLKREEQDRRLAEGILRRRKLRDHLEDLKRQRIFQQEEQRRREENEKLLKQLMELEEEKRRQEELLRQQAHDSMMKERRLMGLEEHTQRELHIRTRETHLMEHEDIMSFMVSQAVARAEKKKLLRLCALEELYVPFEPFQFRNERTNYKEMERFLAEEMDCLASILGKKTPFDEPIAMSVGTRSTKASEISFAKETKSTLYKKSSRHSLLYDIDRLKSNDSLVSSISLASLESAPDWLKAKKSDAKEEKRMLLDSNPSKIQDFPSVTKHIQSDYNHEWKIFPDMSPQCFVLTSKSTFPSISRDGKVATNRNLAKLAPIFDSSKRQHEIEKVRNEQEKMNLLSTFVNVTSSMRDRMDASLNMADSILSKTVNGSDNGARYKFDGSDVASLIPSIKPVFAPSSAESGSPLNNSKNELLQNSKADESMDVSLQSGYRVILPIVPKEYNSNNDVNRRGIAEGIKDLESMELRSSQNNSSSINQSLSIFRPSIWRTNAEKNNLGNTKRQELKKLLTASAEAVQLEDQKEKLLFSSSQKVLSFASLASIDSHDPKGKPRKVNKANKDTKVVPVKGKLGEKKRGALLNELSFNIGEEGLMDSRTKKLATKAGEVVERMQKERALLRNYISSNAVFGDNYYLQTCEPEERQHTSLSVADDVLNYIHGGSIGKEWLPDNEVRRSMLASNSVEIEQKSRSFISNHTSQFLSDSKSTTSRENSNNITDGDKMKLLSRTLSSTSPRAMSAKVPSLSPDGLLLVKEVHAQYPPMSPISKKRKETTRINANRRPIDLVINTPIAMSNHDKSREKALTLELMIEGNRNISGDQLYPDGLEDSIDSSPAPDHRTRGKLASPSRLIQMSISDDGADSIITK